MLPITLGNQELEPLFISFYSVGSSTNTQNLLQSLGLSQKACIVRQDRTYIDFDARITAVFLNDNTAELSILEASDGVIFVLDAATGVSAEAVSLWQSLADFEIPRQIVATNLFQTHTDFDELVAISRRILSPDILVRYLPMADDEETKVVAIYDLLQNLILDYTTGTEVIARPDVEHVELTADQRESLVENLAYLGLPDEALAMYQSGITPAVKQFEDAWNADSIVSVSPLDIGAGAKILRDWMFRLPNRWNPSLESDEHQTHTSTPNFYGYGIATGLARTWGSLDTAIEISDQSGETEPATQVNQFASCVLADNIAVDDTLHEQGQSLSLVAPTFD